MQTKYKNLLAPVLYSKASCNTPRTMSMYWVTTMLALDEEISQAITSMDFIQ